MAIKKNKKIKTQRVTTLEEHNSLFRTSEEKQNRNKNRIEEKKHFPHFRFLESSKQSCVTSVLRVLCCCCFEQSSELEINRERLLEEVIDGVFSVARCDRNGWFWTLSQNGSGYS